jgi:hypothetical protein
MDLLTTVDSPVMVAAYSQQLDALGGRPGFRFIFDIEIRICSVVIMTRPQFLDAGIRSPRDSD